jgi:SAM-dependent methyltransferase
MRSASLQPGQHVLDVACGTGLVSFAAAKVVGPGGRIVGIDISGEMVEAARRRADDRVVPHATFERMDAEKLELPDATFDVAFCALGLMYVCDPAQALREMRRVLKAEGRLSLAVWGERSRCAWSEVFPIVENEVSSEVCPLFFQLGGVGTLSTLCLKMGFDSVEAHRVAVTLDYPDADEMCRAAFVGGPVALAWSRFDQETRERVCERYVAAQAPYRYSRGYRLPGEFVIVSAVSPG